MYKLWYYARNSDGNICNYVDEGTLDVLTTAHINYWKGSNYDLSIFSGVRIQNVQTGQEYVHMFTKPNDWEGFDLSVFEPKPEIRPRSIIEI